MKVCLSLFLLSVSCILYSQEMYFPPLTGDQWAAIQPKELGWCEDNIESLHTFLAEKGTKAFIVLKDGKIVIEKYFENFTKDSIWYWASAGKSLAGFLTGMVQERGLLNIQDKTSKYLGQGWTNLSMEQENKITLWHHLSMTTGLDDNVSDDNCMLPSCLNFKAIPGTRWAYHNAPYRLIHEVIGKAWGSTMQNFMNIHLTLKTGISGLWLDGVMYSKPRSMARFGLLMLNSGNWNGQKILSDQNFIQSMVTPSQNLNNAYGLLWWLNGKPTFMLPGSQFVFSGALIPNAPDDMWCALGKNDQKIYILPSEKIVIIRMGNEGGQITGALSSFDNLLWEKLNKVFCLSSNDEDISYKNNVSIYPNPFTDKVTIQILNEGNPMKFELLDLDGQVIYKGNQIQKLQDELCAGLKKGLYFLKIENLNTTITIKKIVKL